ncbi:MAG: hypothetical protein KJN63_07290 [Acidimicrobiia bacterium]|nr:hypothetical protein [Acidimicrobiia bacterium]
MWSEPAFGRRTARIAIALGLVGCIGAAIAVVVPGSDVSAAAVLSIVAFHLVSGVRTLTLVKEHDELDLTGAKPISTG